MEQVSQLPDLHRKIAHWKGEVDAVRQELSALTNELEKFAGRYVTHSDLAEVEHFQNQFILQKEVSDELFHDLKQESKRITLGSAAAGDAYGEMIRTENDYLSERMRTFNTLYTALKARFSGFIEKKL
jgi:hypothetical protein